MSVVADFLDDGVVSPIGLFVMIYIVFRMRWYVARFIFHCFGVFWEVASLLAILFGSIEMLEIRESSEVQAICHCSTVN